VTTTGLNQIHDDLATGELNISGRLVDASNTTLLAEVLAGGRVTQCIYKPIEGERPLWDFPRGSLARREVATYLLAKDLGLSMVPATVMRSDGPMGAGMVQAWVGEADYETRVRITDTNEAETGYLPVIHARDASGNDVVVEHLADPGLRSLTLFDVVVNNADRKGGHLFMADGQIYGVDHGLTWHEEPKLRTVLWGWAGQPFDADDSMLLERMSRSLSEANTLTGLVTDDELSAARGRLESLRKLGHFPTPQTDEPNIPWPVF